MPSLLLRLYRNQLLLPAVACLLLGGCATLEGPENPDDPYESFNRGMFAFNETVDDYALKPVARAYNFVMPDFLNKAVTNFFNNLDDIVVFANELLQFKFDEALETSARFVFNTTFGLLGTVDVASSMDLPKHHEDFGQTLAVWGVDSGPYLVLPLIGPSTLRDGPALLVDWTAFDPVFNRQTVQQTVATVAVKYIDQRANLLAASNIIDESVPDKYAFIRDAWMERRRFLIYDGQPPDDSDDLSDEELFNDEL